MRLLCGAMAERVGGRGGGPGAGGGPGGGRGRYMKGRLPEGVDFAAYPGRSSTPLPTAESKGAERINQLKIWNEAATNDDKRGLKGNMGKNQALTTTGSGNRRTDSFKDAKERHSSSFQGDGTPISAGGAAAPAKPKMDMFADRSDDDESEEEGTETEMGGDGKVNDVEAIAPEKEVEAIKAAAPAPPAAAPPAAAPKKPATEAPAAEAPKEKGGCCVIV